MIEPKPLHVILGAGQIARLLADRLVALGFRVRLVRRGPSRQTRENLSWARGDLRDRGFAEEATSGASVVYQCSVPPYEKWFDELAALWRGGLHGALRARARYVVLDNMYLYGRVASVSVDEDAPIRPNSRKGELRAQLSEEITAAHLRGDVQATIGRASDFVGPGTRIAIIFHEEFYRRALARKSAEVPGDPDQLHSFSYTPDVADALAILGIQDEALGKIWHLPVLPPQTTRAIVERMQRALGAPERVDAVPDDLLEELGQRNRVIREVVEMTYLYKHPFVVDDRRFRAAFARSATPTSSAIDVTAR